MEPLSTRSAHSLARPFSHLCAHPYPTVVLQVWEDGCKGRVLPSQLFSWADIKALQLRECGLQKPLLHPRLQESYLQWTAEALEEVITVPCHLFPLDKVETECQRGAGSSLRTHSKAGASGACRPESPPELQGRRVITYPRPPCTRGAREPRQPGGTLERKNTVSAPRGMVGSSVHSANLSQSPARG